MESVAIDDLKRLDCKSIVSRRLSFREILVTNGEVFHMSLYVINILCS
jgi:hypothetical protein